jgi:hypothetical protein
MSTRKHAAYAAAALFLTAAVAINAKDNDCDDDSGRAHLDVYAELTQSGIAAITQMQNGQLIIGYHPFYLTPTSVQVATLNHDRRSSTPYPLRGRGCCRAAGIPMAASCRRSMAGTTTASTGSSASMRMRMASCGSSTPQSQPTGRIRCTRGRPRYMRSTSAGTRGTTGCTR